MHELSIAQSILGIVENTVKENNAVIVKELELEIGLLAGVEFEALDFALRVISNDSILRNTSIIVNKSEGKANCLDCGKIFTLNSLFESCPACNGYRYKIIKGKELRVKSILVD